MGLASNHWIACLAFVVSVYHQGFLKTCPIVLVSAKQFSLSYIDVIAPFYFIKREMMMWQFKGRFNQRVILSLGVVATSCGIALADVESSNQRVEFGIDALKAGDVATALSWLATAQQRGADHPDLFNALGLAYLLDSDYANAKQYFLLAREGRRRHEAAFHLGKIAIAQGERDAAERWFQLAADQYEDIEVQRQADRSLRRLMLALNEDESLLEKTESLRKFAFISAQLGYQKGITNPDDSSDDDDFSLATLAAGSFTVTPENTAWVVKLGASGYVEQYQEITSYNVLSWSVFSTLEHVLNDQHTVQARAAYTRFDVAGDPYIAQQDVGLKSTLKLPLQKTLISYAKLADVVSPDGSYAHLEGTQLSLGGELRGGARFKWRGGVDLRSDDRAGLVRSLSNAAGDTFEGYSSASKASLQLKARLSWDWTTHWQQKIEASLRTTRYVEDDVYLEDTADSVVTSSNRSSMRTQLKAELSREMSRQLEVSVGVEMTDEDSNIDRYDYDNMSISSGLSYLF